MSYFSQVRQFLWARVMTCKRFLCTEGLTQIQTHGKGRFDVTMGRFVSYQRKLKLQTKRIYTLLYQNILDKNRLSWSLPFFFWYTRSWDLGNIFVFMICKIQLNLCRWKVRCISPSCYGKTTHSNNKTPLNPCGHNVTWITSRQREVYLISLLNGNTYLSNLKNSHKNISVWYRKKNKNTPAWAWKTLFSLKGEKKSCVKRQTKAKEFNPR